MARRVGGKQCHHVWTVAVWTATYGLAVLRLDGPLRHLTEDEYRAATERQLDLILAGLANDPPA
jgi:hypothetical protein